MKRVLQRCWDMAPERMIGACAVLALVASVALSAAVFALLVYLLQFTFLFT